MTIDAWLTHYSRQPGYTIKMQWQGKVLHYVVYDDDGIIVDWRPVYE